MNEGAAFHGVAAPYGGVWSSPFARVGGGLAACTSLGLAAHVTKRALAGRSLHGEQFNRLVLGCCVPRPDVLGGTRRLAVNLGMQHAADLTVSQDCATSVTTLHLAAGAVAAGRGGQLVVVADRSSDSPAPEQTGPRFEPTYPDPSADDTKVRQAEVTAAEAGFTRADTDHLVALRCDQYATSMCDNRAFQRRFLVEVRDDEGRRLLVADQGIRLVKAEHAAQLPSVSPGGMHSTAARTHPADGAGGAVLTTVAHARELSMGQGIVRFLATGFATVRHARMVEAVVLAAESALSAAGLPIDAVDAVTTHSPFAIHDLYFARETGVKLDDMNRFGSSLVFGHSHGATGMRSLAQLVETLRLRGGGIGLFATSSAGSCGASLVVEVTD